MIDSDKEKGTSLVEIPFSAMLMPLSASRQLFLSYTAGREHGPGIERSGKEPEYMQWLGKEISEDTRGNRARIVMRQKTTWRVGEPNDVSRFDLRQKPNPDNCDHCSYFWALTQGQWRILAMQGCGNLSMNEWFVAYYNPLSGLSILPDPYRARNLIFLAREAPSMASRAYTCLVKWRGLQDSPTTMAIQTLRFDLQFPEYWVYAHANEIPAAYLKREDVKRFGSHEELVNLTEAIEFAIYGQQVIRKTKAVSLEEIAHQFFDVRHLFRLPRLPPDHYFSRKKRWRPWFGEAELLDKPELCRNALSRPIVLDCLYGGMGADPSKVSQSFIDLGYDNTQELAPQRPGEFRLIPADRPHSVEVWLLENVYAYSFVGLAKPREERIAEADRKFSYFSNMLVLFAAGGKPGQRGLTLQEAIEALRTQIQELEVNKMRYEVYDALLMDEGYDVFQYGPGSQFRVPVEGSRLPTEDPEPYTIGRDRVKAVFIVAETQEQGKTS